MTCYQGTYTDAQGTEPLVCENNGKVLSCTIRGLTFSGREWSDLALLPTDQPYTAEQLSLFTWLPDPRGERPTLCACRFVLALPQILLDLQHGGQALPIILQFEYTLGDWHPQRLGLTHEHLRLSVELKGVQYSGEGGFFELALASLQSQWQGQYHFQNCFGCMFGDYSVYGQSSFGTMLCFRAQKEAYLAVQDKDDYMELIPAEDLVQETHCCTDFLPRRQGAGYRG